MLHAQNRPTLSHHTESRLLQAVDSVGDSVADGLAPTESLIKVSREYGLNENHVRLVGYAYNTAESNAQRLAESSILNKLASHPLCDPESAVLSLFPLQSSPQVKAASVSGEDYTRPPRWLNRSQQDAVLVKAASTPVLAVTPTDSKPRSAEDVFSDAFNRYLTQKRAVEMYRGETMVVELKLSEKLASVTSFLKTADVDPSGAGFRAEVARLAGRNGVLILNKLAASLADPNDFWVKRPAKQASVKAGRRQDKPYAELADAAELLSTLHDRQQKLAKAESALAVRHGQLMKRADMPDFAGYAMGKEISENQRSQPSRLGFAPKEDLVQDSLHAVATPSHESSMRKIQSTAMLHDMLANDETLSDTDPDDVLAAYNSLAEMLPSTMKNPGSAKPLLRRYLAGNLEPFEVEQLSKIEKNFANPGSP